MTPQLASASSISKLYRDYANSTESCLKEREILETIGVNTSNDKNFPVRLHYMLNEIEKDGLQHIVSWQPHGRCFIVHDQKAFVKDILPFWFRQGKIASFQRQLNIYGFTRITSGRDKGGYYHVLFLRGKQFLAQGIRRIKVKGTGPRKPNSSENTPDFYSLPFLPFSRAEESASPAVQSVQPAKLSAESQRLSLANLLHGNMQVDTLSHLKPIDTALSGYIPISQRLAHHCLEKLADPRPSASTFGQFGLGSATARHNAQSTVNSDLLQIAIETLTRQHLC